jgi:hypothetical protein
MVVVVMYGDGEGLSKSGLSIGFLKPRTMQFGLTVLRSGSNGDALICRIGTLLDSSYAMV